MLFRSSGADARKGGVYEARRRDDGERQSRPDQTAKSCSSPAGARRTHYKFSHEPPAFSPRVHPDPDKYIHQRYVSPHLADSVHSRSPTQPSGVRALRSLARPGTTHLSPCAAARQTPDSPVWLCTSTAVNVGQQGPTSSSTSSGDAPTKKPVPFLNARSTSGRTSP